MLLRTNLAQFFLQKTLYARASAAEALRPPDPYWAFVPGPYWVTSVPRLPILEPPASKTSLRPWLQQTALLSSLDWAVSH